jgi:hypothetical protein
MVPIRRGDEVAPANFQEMTLLNEQKNSWAKPAPPPLEQLEEYLTDPAKQAKVRSLVLGEARKLYATLNDEEFLKKDADGRYATIVERMGEYEEMPHPFSISSPLAVIAGPSGSSLYGRRRSPSSRTWRKDAPARTHWCG